MTRSFIYDSSEKTLTDRIHRFAAKLRDSGVKAGPAEIMTAIEALDTGEIGDKDTFKYSLRVILCSKKEDLHVFDLLFPLFFHKGKYIPFSGDELHVLSPDEKKQQEKLQPGQRLKNSEKTEEEASSKMADLVTEAEGEDGYENSANKDETPSGETGDPLSDIESGAEAHMRLLSAMRSPAADDPESYSIMFDGTRAEVYMRAASQFSSLIRLKKSRTWRPELKGSRIHFRRLMRQNVQRGGMAGKLPYLNRKIKKAKFVFICDASRSMSGFTEQFLIFATAMAKTAADVEVFLFSNKLKRITSQMSAIKHGRSTVLEVSADAWGTGTRIGESLQTFTNNYNRFLTDHTVVVIGSDGLDSGGAGVLKQSMNRIRMNSAAVIWFNPLLAIEGYEAEAAGMKAALPYIDVFHNAAEPASFREAAAKLKSGRGAR